MSTIVVTKKDGYVAIGADTLTKYGYTNESAEYIENHSKIIKIGENYIASVGHGSWGLVLKSYFTSLAKMPSLGTELAIFEVIREMHRVLKDKYYLNPKEGKSDAFESSQFSCLIANPFGIFGIDSLRSVQQYSKFHALGAGYKFALGAMHAIYDRAPSAKDIALAGLEASADFDEDTGRPLEIHAIKLKKETQKKIVT